MGLKASRYNYTTTIPDGTGLFFNFYTLNLIALAGEEISGARELLLNPESRLSPERDHKLRKLFEDKGFLIDETIDERNLLKNARWNERRNTKNLSLTIAPTLQCNFRCSYCYQPAGNTQIMTQKMQRSLLRFAAEELNTGGSMHVTWFGGEPLLRLDIVERLTNGLVEISEAAQADYSASIITNGFLMDRECADKLKNMRIKKAQVTLDGPPEIHNERRITKGGGATFKQIMDNLEGAHQNLKISLRMNIDSTNQDRVDEMLDILVGRELQKSIGFYVGQVKPYTDLCRDASSCCLTNDQFSIMGLKTLLSMADRKFASTFNLPRSSGSYCIAESQKGFVIAPNGGIFKCWNEIGDPAAAVGHVNGAVSDTMRWNRAAWEKRDPFNLECSDCLLLPICMGGCPYNYLRWGTLDCHCWKTHTDQHLMFYYILKKTEKQKEITERFRDIVDAVEKLKSQRNSTSAL